MVPGGVDPSGERRVIPALLALLRRLAAQHQVFVFALWQDERTASWDLHGAQVLNVGRGRTRWRALRAILAEHRRQRFDVVHAFWSGAPGLVAVAAARRLGIPSLVHVAGGELVALPDIGYGSVTRRARLREWTQLHLASVVTAASAPMVARLADWGIDALRVPLGVDLAQWPAREPQRRPPGRPARVVHVASLNRVKDQTTLLQAFARLRASGVDFTADIVGEDTLHGEIQALAATLQLTDIVRFHGFKVQRELWPLVAGSDLLLMSSRHEAGPLAVLEAGALGVPTVGTAVGHILEWAPRAALAAPPQDAAGLAQAAARLLQHEDERLRLAHEARSLALMEDADYTARRFQQIYEEVTAR